LRSLPTSSFNALSAGCIWWAALVLSIPVATTETRTMPSRLSSKVAPTMMLASWSASSRMRVAASSTSNSVRSLPPVIEISRPLARLIEGSSISGLEIAASAAVKHAPRRKPRPCPSSPCLLAHHGAHSAKSRLIRPSFTIRSVIQATPA
jgi:hypothetical protein